MNEHSPKRVIAFVLLATAGCAQILGLHDRPEAGDAGAGSDDSVLLTAGECGQLIHPSVSCASCMDESCCAQAIACAEDTACREASDCLAACTDASCRATCAAFYTLPDTLIALRACRVRECAGACGSSCGEFAYASTSCEACQQASCCSQATACAADAECAALNLCVSNCFGSSSCPTACQSEDPLGTTDFATWSSCANDAACAAQCQPGQSWACLDAPIIWPKPSSVGSISFSVTFVDFSLEQPFVGATVKACDKLDLPCASPLASSTTDGTGLVKLTVATGPVGFDGYLDVRGGVGATGAPPFPSLWYPVPFIVADGWRGRTELLAADEFAGLAAATGVTPDPTRGNFALNAVDCAFTPAPGVSFSVDIADTQTVGYYLLGGVPTTTATDTDGSGVGAFLNLPAASGARFAVVKASAGAAGGKAMGSLSFIIRPGTLTTGSSYPPIP